jgi:hypothetical protein
VISLGVVRGLCLVPLFHPDRQSSVLEHLTLLWLASHTILCILCEKKDNPCMKIKKSPVGLSFTFCHNNRWQFAKLLPP